LQYQKISIFPPTEGIGISRGVRGSLRPKNLKKFIKFNWNFQRGGGLGKKSLPWGRYVYFLELHILINEYETKENKIKKQNFVTQCINLHCCKIIF